MVRYFLPSFLSKTIISMVKQAGSDLEKHALNTGMQVAHDILLGMSTIQSLSQRGMASGSRLQNHPISLLLQNQSPGEPPTKKKKEKKKKLIKKATPEAMVSKSRKAKKHGCLRDIFDD